MAVTATPEAQVQRIADTEAERNIGWSAGSRVWCKDTKKFYILEDGAWVLIGPGTGGGGVDGAANVGTAGVGVFKQLSGSTLQFKKLNPGSSKLTVTDDTGNSEVDLDVDANATVAASTDARLSDARTPTAHATSHVTGGTDVIANAVAAGNAGLMTGTDKTKLDGIAAGAEVNVNPDWNAGSGDAQILNKPATFAPSAHAASHQNNGGDEISVAGLSGLLADGQTPLAHNILTAHNGFPGGTSTFLRADGSFATPPGGGGMAVGTATLDFGATPAYEAEVTVTTSGLTTATRLQSFVQKETTTGGGDVANGLDEHEMLAFFGRFVCEYISATQFKIKVTLADMLAIGQFKIGWIGA